jgi:hypothetical protein
MSRFVSVAILAVAFGTLCCSNSSSPPPVMSPPLPLANRIQPPDPSKYATYEDVPWNEWTNPRVTVTSEGIKVLLLGTSNGSTVPPERVGDVLAKTTSSDWPLGLIVMAKYGFRRPPDGRPPEGGKKRGGVVEYARQSRHTCSVGTATSVITEVENAGWRRSRCGGHLKQTVENSD